MTAIFLVFDDDRAVQLNKVVSIQALSDADIDPATAKLRRPIPEGSRTRIDTVSGYFWTTTAYEDVIERLRLAESLGADHG